MDLSGWYSPRMGRDSQVIELRGFVGDITFYAFLIEMSAFIVFIIFGRKLLKNETTGWEQT